jgi:hypothetical protein
MQRAVGLRKREMDRHRDDVHRWPRVFVVRDFPPATKFNPGGIPADPVPFAAFAERVATMLSDPALKAHFNDQVLLSTTKAPAAGTVYDMPCVT